MNTRTRAYALSLALLLAVLSAFSVFGEGGDGSGGGENHDKPLVLDHCNITNGQENVDPNVRIEMYFTKNVVNIVVREENKKCFSVTDGSGNKVPITVEMGDDQVEPTDAVKRTVTIVPAAPYKAGESYLLKVSKGLAAKNGRDVLEKDIYIGFTIAGETTTAYHYSPQYSDPTTTTTTTTTKPAETSTRAPRTTGPVIVAASGTTTAKTENVSQTTTRKAATTTKPAVSSTVTQSSAAAQTTVTTVVTTLPEPDGTTTETFSQTETFAAEESTIETTAESVSEQPETVSKAQTTEPSAENDGRRVSPALTIGILIAIAAAAAVIGILLTKKKKG